MSLTHRRLFERCSAFTKYTWRADINMASQQPICEQLISVLAHQPREIMNGMIGTMTTVSRNKPTSTPTVRLGDFAKLPLEIEQYRRLHQRSFCTATQHICSTPLCYRRKVSLVAGTVRSCSSRRVNDAATGVSGGTKTSQSCQHDDVSISQQPRWNNCRP